MESVALPAGSFSNALGTETNLARSAAHNDADAFAELFHRHSQSMWRLAQAVTPDADAAASAVSDGFVRVLRSVRRRQTNAQEALRPLLLAGTYRAALDMVRRPEQAQRDAEATAEHLRSGEREVDEALAMAAFRSLPERWRAAVWLREVEGLEPDAVAPVLGVSTAVATQLTARGRRGLLGRFAQAAMEPPTHLGGVLRPLAAGVPTTLEDATMARWRKGVPADPAGRWLPAGWMSEKAGRPLSIASAGVLAIGLIGLGVLGQHTGLLPGGAIQTAGAPSGTNPGVTASGGGSSTGGYTTGAYGGQITSPLTNFLTAAYGTGAAAPAATLSGPGSGSSGSTPPGGTSAPTTGSGNAGPATTTPTTRTSPITTPAPSVTSTSPTTLLGLGPIGSVTKATTPSGGSTNTINLIQLPGSSAPVASVSVGACTQINLLGIKIPVSCPAGTAPGSVLSGATTPTTSTPKTTTTSTTVPLLGGLGL